MTIGAVTKRRKSPPMSLFNRKIYAPLAIAAGALLLGLSLLYQSPGDGGSTSPPGSDSFTNANERTRKKQLEISRELISSMVDSALAENPSLRENKQMLRGQIRKGLEEEEMIVAEAVRQGLASTDPIARNRLRELIILGLYQEADAGLTSEAIKEYYRNHKRKYFMPEMRKARHLFVRVTNVTDDEKAHKTLKKLLAEAKGPEEGQSEDLKKAIAPKWITRSEVTSRFGPTFADTFFSVEPGGWSEPIRSTSGWHTIEILEVSPARQRSFEEVEAQVKSDLQKKLRHEAYVREIERLSEEYEVKIVP